MKKEVKEKTNLSATNSKKENSEKISDSNNKSKKKKRIILLCLLGALVIGAGVAVPLIVLNANKETIISDKIEDLLPADQKTKELIVNNVDISNVKVVLGKDFSTTITLKEESKPDFDIAGIEVYSHDAVTLNSAKNSTSNDNLKKLERNKDYTFVNEKKNASLKVFGASFKSKLELHIDIKEISFNRIVEFNDISVGYDNKSHDIKLSLKEGRTLPTGTSVTYTYNEETKTGEEYFSFINAGVYKVSLTLKADGYIDYNKTATLTINKSDLPEEEKAKISFIKLSCKENNIIPPEIQNNSSLQFIDTPKILYKVNNEWTETLPTKFGEYAVKATLNFENYNSYDLTDVFVINEVGVISITFDVSTNGGIWGKGGTKDAKISDKIKVSLEQKTFGDFKNTVKDYVDPTKEGYTFTGWYSDPIASTTKYEDTTEILKTLDEDFTVYAQFNINHHTLTLDGNGGTPTTATIGNVAYDTVLINAIGENVATHEDASFKGWGLDASKQDVLTDDDKMPDNDLTVYAIWHKYDFEFFVSEGAHGSVVDIATHNNQITLKAEDFASTLTVTPDAGYSHNNKFDVYVDDESTSRCVIDFSSGEILKPGKFDTPVNKDCKIRLEPVFEAQPFTATFNKNGGSITMNGIEQTSLNINTDDLVLEKLNSYKATHEYAGFNYWQMVKQDGTKITIDNTTTMPPEIVTITPIWHTYKVKVFLNGTYQEGLDKTDVLKLYSDELGVTIPSGQVIKGFKYRFGTSGDWVNADLGMPFKPYAYNTTDFTSEVCLNVITDSPSEIIEVMLDAGEGASFEDGIDFKTLDTSKGTTLGDVLNIVGTPKKGSSTPIKWVDDDGTEYTTSSTLSSSILLHAVYEG